MKHETKWNDMKHEHYMNQSWIKWINVQYEHASFGNYRQLMTVGTAIWHNLATTRVLHKRMINQLDDKSVVKGTSLALMKSLWNPCIIFDMSMSTFYVLCFKFQERRLMMFDDFSSIWIRLHNCFWREFLGSSWVHAWGTSGMPMTPVSKECRMRLRFWKLWICSRFLKWLS